MCATRASPPYSLAAVLLYALATEYRVAFGALVTVAGDTAAVITEVYVTSSSSNAFCA